MYKRQHKMNTNAVMRLLRAYALLDKSCQVEETIRQSIVQPFMEEQIVNSKLDGSTRGSCEGLPLIFESILQFIETQFGSILSAYKTLNPLDLPDLFGNAIWQPMEEHIAVHLRDIFKPGLPDLFQKV